MPDQAKISFHCESCGKAYRVAAELAGRGAKCKACGAKMRVPKPAPADDDDEVFSIDELEAMGDGPAEPARPDEVFSMDDLAQLADEPPTPTSAPTAPASASPAGETNMLEAAAAVVPLAPSARAGKRQSSKQNPVAALHDMWQAFTTAPQSGSGGKQLPKVRHVSMGGVFLVIGAVLLLVFSGFRVPMDKVAEARSMVKEWPVEPVDAADPAGMVTLGILAGLVGLGMIGRRLFLPRQEQESPLVLIAFYALTALLVAGSLFVLIGGGEVVKGVAQLGGLGIVIGVAAFGVWMLHRLTMDGDGTAIWLIILPAIAAPICHLIFVLAAMSDAPAQAWEQFPWDMYLLSLFGVAIAMVLMGGAISFMLLLVTPLLLLGLVSRQGILASFGGSDLVIGGMVLACYLLLVTTRWKIIFKPVAWQFVLILIGGNLMANFYNYHAHQAVLAEAEPLMEKDTGKSLTERLRERGLIGPGVEASRQPYQNSSFFTNKKDLDVVYLSDGGVIINPFEPKEDDENGPQAPDTPGPSRPKPPVQTPPQPIFTQFVLPRGTERLPSRDTAWLPYDPPTLDVKPNQTVECWGYRLELLPGYRVALKGTDDGRRTLRIVGPQRENPSTALELELVPYPTRRDGGVSVGDWPLLLRAEDIDDEEHFIDYGMIGTMQFVRGAPSDKMRDRYREQVVYLARTTDTRERVVMRIPVDKRPDADLLASEFMARSLERDPVEMADAQPAQGVDVENSLIDFDDPTLRETRWRTAGIFATAGLYGRAADTNTGGLYVTYSIGGNNASIALRLEPIQPGQTRAYRVQAKGPVRAPTPGDGFTGKTIHAFGGYVNHDRLWNDELFIRVEHGVTSIQRGESTQAVTYYGRLGGYWMTASLFRDADKGPPMRELEDALRRIRLASALEVAADSTAMRDWVPGILQGGKADLPLAGGTTVAQAFEIDALGRARLSTNIDPDTGRYVPIYPPLAASKLEPFKQWGGFPELDKHLGDAERVGPISIRPIAELKRSSRSNDRRTEWFTNTDSGRVSISMRIDLLEEGEQPIAIPVSKDPDTGETLLQIGNRTLREDGEVSVAYRESRGLRVWRIVMPQIGAASLRRCYYIAEMPGRRLTISADFERDQAVQLQAIDTSMATLIYKPPPKIE